jgi:hypothetical protein
MGGGDSGGRGGTHNGGNKNYNHNNICNVFTVDLRTDLFDINM